MDKWTINHGQHKDHRQSIMGRLETMLKTKPSGFVPDSQLQNTQLTQNLFCILVSDTPDLTAGPEQINTECI